MAKAEIFHVVNNVALDFESEGLKYDMKLLIEDGLIILKDSKGREKILFLGEETEYTGEVTSEVTESVTAKPKKRRSKKKTKH